MERERRKKEEKEEAERQENARKEDIRRNYEGLNINERLERQAFDDQLPPPNLWWWQKVLNRVLPPSPWKTYGIYTYVKPEKFLKEWNVFHLKTNPAIFLHLSHVAAPHLVLQPSFGFMKNRSFMDCSYTWIPFNNDTLIIRGSVASMGIVANFKWNSPRRIPFLPWPLDRLQWELDTTVTQDRATARFKCSFWDRTGMYWLLKYGPTRNWDLTVTKKLHPILWLMTHIKYDSTDGAIGTDITAKAYLRNNALTPKKPNYYFAFKYYESNLGRIRSGIFYFGRTFNPGMSRGRCNIVTALSLGMFDETKVFPPFTMGNVLLGVEYRLRIGAWRGKFDFGNKTATMQYDEGIGRGQRVQFQTHIHYPTQKIKFGVGFSGCY